MDPDASSNLNVVQNGVVFRMRPATSMWSSPAPTLVPKNLVENVASVTEKPASETGTTSTAQPPLSSREAFNALCQKSPMPKILCAKVQQVTANGMSPATAQTPVALTPVGQRRRYIFRPAASPAPSLTTSVESQTTSAVSTDVLPPKTSSATTIQPLTSISMPGFVTPTKPPPTDQNTSISMNHVISAKPPTPLRFPVSSTRASTQRPEPGMTVSKAQNSQIRTPVKSTSTNNPFSVPSSSPHSPVRSDKQVKTRLSFDPDEEPSLQKKEHVQQSTTDASLMVNPNEASKSLATHVSVSLDVHGDEARSMSTVPSVIDVANSPEPSTENSFLKLSKKMSSSKQIEVTPVKETKGSPDVQQESKHNSNNEPLEAPSQETRTRVVPESINEAHEELASKKENISVLKPSKAKITTPQRPSTTPNKIKKSPGSIAARKNKPATPAPSSKVSKLTKIVSPLVDTNREVKLPSPPKELPENSVLTTQLLLSSPSTPRGKVALKKRGRQSRSEDELTPTKFRRLKQTHETEVTKTVSVRRDLEKKGQTKHGKNSMKSPAGKTKLPTTTSSLRDTRSTPDKSQARGVSAGKKTYNSLEEVSDGSPWKNSPMEDPTPSRERQLNKKSFTSTQEEEVANFLSFDEDDDDGAERNTLALRKWYVVWPVPEKNGSMRLIIRGLMGSKKASHELLRMKGPRQFISNKEKAITLVGSMDEDKCISQGMPQRFINYFAQGIPAGWMNKVLVPIKKMTPTKTIASLSAFLDSASEKEDQIEEEEEKSFSDASVDIDRISQRSPAVSVGRKLTPKKRLSYDFVSESSVHIQSPKQFGTPTKRVVPIGPSARSPAVSVRRKQYLESPKVKSTPSKQVVPVGSATKRTRSGREVQSTKDWWKIEAPVLKSISVPSRGPEKEREDDETDVWTSSQLNSLKQAINEVDPKERNYWDKVALYVDKKTGAQCQAKQFEDLGSAKKNRQPARQKQTHQALSKAGTQKFKKQVRQFVQHSEATYADDVWVPSREVEAKAMKTPQSIKKFKQKFKESSSDESDPELLAPISSSRRDDVDKYVVQFRQKKQGQPIARKKQWADDDSDNGIDLRSTARIGARKLEGVLTPRGSTKVRVLRNDDSSDESFDAGEMDSSDASDSY
ncbi:hypothetical protein Ae201684_012152 [Aphanomyces euteiches]|uniref:SANTA domain-containing protein n=1 Tax=Aphanomyces euteiches TaxID=100861 RepID=A0A6G0WSI8_9STRA|nr:hypothetical protein Ae201684_012152 [Aphanomyces euteiches]KAH9134693.1 hypothetical protein AeRB84_019570 [Aphanomyces euteiches]